MLVNKLRVWCLVVLGAALLAGCQQATVTSEKPPAKAPVHLRLRLKGPMGESEGIGLTFAMFGGGGKDAK